MSVRSCTSQAPAFGATPQWQKLMLACKLQRATACRYDRDMKAMLEAASVAETAWDAQRWHGDVRLQYQSQQQFEQLADAFGMMSEWRDGVPRAAYHGVVSRLSLESETLKHASIREGVANGQLAWLWTSVF